MRNTYPLEFPHLTMRHRIYVWHFNLCQLLRAGRSPELRKDIHGSNPTPPHNEVMIRVQAPFGGSRLPLFTSFSSFYLILLHLSIKTTPLHNAPITWLDAPDPCLLDPIWLSHVAWLVSRNQHVRPQLWARHDVTVSRQPAIWFSWAILGRYLETTQSIGSS